MIRSAALVTLTALDRGFGHIEIALDYLDCLVGAIADNRLVTGSKSPRYKLALLVGKPARADAARPFHFDIEPEITAARQRQEDIRNARLYALRFQSGRFPRITAAAVRDGVQPPQYGKIRGPIENRFLFGVFAMVHG